jgi:hypothetical protein
MSKARNLAVLAATMLTALVGCVDSPTSPSTQLQVSNAKDGKLLGELLGAVTGLLVPPLKRTTPLTSDVSWTFVAGPGGATSSNSTVGLTVSVPAGALATTTTIRVTAVAGSAVAYAFEPHLEFAKGVTLTQSLRGTTAGLLALYSGAHFDGDRPTFTSGGLAIVDELVPALGGLLTHTVSFKVDHFSGWIVASGRCQ